jgi:hypothetical protein
MKAVCDDGGQEFSVFAPPAMLLGGVVLALHRGGRQVAAAARARRPRDWGWYARCTRLDMPRLMALAFPAGLVVLAACSGASQVPSEAPTVTSVVPLPVTAAGFTLSPSPARATPLALRSIPPPTGSPPALATPESTAQQVWVGNTDGGGVYLRNSPHEGDRADVLPDGTPLTVIGDEVEGDGQRWYFVRTPDGTDGYVPVIYTTNAEPNEAPATPQIPPK